MLHLLIAKVGTIVFKGLHTTKNHHCYQWWQVCDMEGVLSCMHALLYSLYWLGISTNMPKSPSVQHFLGVFPTLSIWAFLISFSFSIPICFLFYHSRITPKHLVYMLLHWHQKVHDWMSHSISNPYGISMTSNQLPLCCLFLSYAGEEP